MILRFAYFDGLGPEKSSPGGDKTMKIVKNLNYVSAALEPCARPRGGAAGLRWEPLLERFSSLPGQLLGVANAGELVPLFMLGVGGRCFAQPNGIPFSNWSQ